MHRSSTVICGHGMDCRSGRDARAADDQRDIDVVLVDFSLARGHAVLAKMVAIVACISYAGPLCSARCGNTGRREEESDTTSSGTAAADVILT